MTTHDALLEGVHVLELGIMCFCGNNINAKMNLQQSGGTAVTALRKFKFTSCNYKLHKNCVTCNYSNSDVNTTKRIHKIA